MINKSKSNNTKIVSKLKSKLRTNKTKLLKIKKLEDELKKLIVIAPFVSEGNISLVQIGRFSDKQKKQWEKNKSRRFDVMDELALLKMTGKEKFKLSLSKKIKTLKSRIIQNESRINYLKDFPQIKSSKLNKLKKSFLKEKEELKENKINLSKSENQLKKL